MTPDPHLTSARLDCVGERLYDALGREVLLRGINAGGRSKLPPFFPFAFAESGRSEQTGAPPFDEALSKYCRRIEDWGLNVVRLPFTWEALEPSRGRWDEEWFARYRRFAEELTSRGLRVIVDFHQDVFGRPFYGDGFPLWACDRPLIDPPPHSPQWFMGYVNSDDVQRNYDRFWANEEGLQDAMEAMWRKVAADLWDIDGVIGFEIINEPGWGTADPTTWAAEVLTPFYSRMAAVLREVADGCLVFFDATGMDAISGRAFLDRPEGPGVVFAPHYYDPAAILEGRWGGETDVDTPLGAWRTFGRQWEIPVLVGEFGICPDGFGARDYVQANYEALDRHLLHGTLWEYSSTVDDWNDEAMSVVDGDGRERATASVMVRAYPAATAGRTTAFEFDARTRSGTWRFEAEEGGVSELAAPTRLFPEGISGRLHGVRGALQHDVGRGRLLLRCHEAGPVTLEFGPAD